MEVLNYGRNLNSYLQNLRRVIVSILRKVFYFTTELI